jgi:hypothetical protein
VHHCHTWQFILSCFPPRFIFIKHIHSPIPALCTSLLGLFVCFSVYFLPVHQKKDSSMTAQILVALFIIVPLSLQSSHRMLST